MDPFKATHLSDSYATSVYYDNTTPMAANVQPSDHPNYLSPARLSNHSFHALNSFKNQGNESEKNLAQMAMDSISGNFLKLGPKQQQNQVAIYGRSVNNNTLVIRAKLNDRSEYDILALGLRKSSGEKTLMKISTLVSAPQAQLTRKPAENTLSGLPLELTQAIMEHISDSSDRRQAVYDLDSLENSARRFKSSLEGHPLLKLNHHIYKRIIGTINKTDVNELIAFADSALFTLASQQKREDCLTAAISKANEFQICCLGQALDKLQPEQRTRLVMTVLSDTNHRDPAMDMADVTEDAYDDEAKGNIIGSFGSGLHTIPEHHAQIIDAVHQLNDPGKAWAINGLGTGLHLLDNTLCEELIQAAADIEDENIQGLAIYGLCAGLSALTELQRATVFDAALTIENELVFAEIVAEGLSKGLQALTSLQQLQLADTVSFMDDEGAQALALQGLGSALKKVSDSHYIEMLAMLSESAMSMQNEVNKAFAISGLGAGLHMQQPLSTLDDENYQQDDENYQQLTDNFVSTALSMSNEGNKSIAIAGLGGGLSALTLEQREYLINASLDMAAEDNKSIAIVGLANGLQMLTSQQRERLVDACLNIENEAYKSETIAGLGASLHTLTSEQQGKLVDATVNFQSVANMKGAIISLRDIKGQQQFGRLVDAAFRLPLRNSGPISPQLLALSSLAERNPGLRKSFIS